MNEKANNDVEQTRKRKTWLRVVEWGSLIGTIIAVLGFIGYPNWQSLRSHLPDFRFSFNLRSWVGADHSPAREVTPREATPPIVSQLTGQTWAFVKDAHEIRLDFDANEVVRFSDSAFADDGHWALVGKDRGGNVVRIDTPQRIIFATQDETGNKMTAMIYRRNGERSTLDATVIMTRVQ